jgi:hypothetical protein
MGLFELFSPSKRESVPLPGRFEDREYRLRTEEEILSVGVPQLVSREDIYARQGDRTVLLLKKGTTVGVDMLGKLVNCGADPAKFSLVQCGEIDQGSAITAIRSGHTNPIGHNNNVDQAVRSIRAGKRVVVVNPDHRQLNRLLGSLVHCGFSLGRLQPVRQLSHLGWSLKKYRPDILIVDDETAPGSNPLESLMELEKELSGLEQIIALVSPESVVLSDPALQADFLEAADRLQVDVLLKPANRFNLNELLTPAEEAIS